MLGIIALIVVLGGIATLARGKGVNPYAAGGAAFSGWCFFAIVLPVFVRAEGARFLLMLSGWAWIALVAGFLRFVLGASKRKPDSKWNCPNCRYLNNASSIVCEACQQAWQPPTESSQG